MKKVILKITKSDDIIAVSKNNDVSIQDLFDTNMKLQAIVSQYKNMITPFSTNKAWDRHKKLSNEYELIFTTPYAKHNVSTYNPVSRSFFKMWEILHDFDKEIIPNSESIKCLFLAEGPGGFLEAVMKFRNSKNDHYYGMTLKPDNKSIPEWKLKKFDMSKITTLYGVDNRGDLYNLANTQYLMDTLGSNSMDIITADGGFDFSVDFNNQEDLSIKLIRCETYCCLNMLKDKGTFILKIYDIFSKNTVEILKILTKVFDTIYLVKPLTSRPANSEKYVVCTGYKCKEGLGEIQNLFNIINNDAISNVADYTNNDKILLNCVLLYNIYYTSRQIFYIQKTLDVIKEFELLTSKEKSSKELFYIQRNQCKCIEWCKKYNIPCLERK